ncbi:MAG: anthranilate/aminodeoxychorismate synthase component II [candidate division Zixibacteria bacterium]|nr:anthranilate/aminodeoxychorismate synthase component II [candidate division Zixibacteria bacterium]
MILLVDNYDSFVYNLYQYLCELGAKVQVRRNDDVKVNEIPNKYDAVVLSPGPGRPADAGVMPEIVTQCSGKLPILGVCLGCQAIGEAFGGKVVRGQRLMHGKTSVIKHNAKGLFTGVDKQFEATRYHSLIVERKSVPKVLTVTAETDDKTIMALRHKTHPTVGVQFHPESILTEPGKVILENFLKGNL